MEKMKAISFSKALILFVVLFVAIVFVATFCFGMNYACADTAFTSAKAMCVMEASSGRVLYEKNSNQKIKSVHAFLPLKAMFMRFRP